MAGKTLETIYLLLLRYYFTDDEMEDSRGNNHSILYFLQGKTLLLNMIKTESINTEFKQHHLNLIDCVLRE